MHNLTPRSAFRPFPDSHPHQYYIFPSPPTTPLLTQAVVHPSLLSVICISENTIPGISGTCGHPPTLVDPHKRGVRSQSCRSRGTTDEPIPKMWCVCTGTTPATPLRLLCSINAESTVARAVHAPHADTALLRYSSNPEEILEGCQCPKNNGTSETRASGQFGKHRYSSQLILDSLLVTLDGRPLKTPSGKPLGLPPSKRKLAALVANEREIRETMIKPHNLPLVIHCTEIYLHLLHTCSRYLSLTSD